MDFRYDGRIVTLREENKQNATLLASVIFWGSVAWYVQRHFRTDRSIPKLAVFTAVSYFAAGEYGKWLFIPIQQEAAIKNNFLEKSKCHHLSTCLQNLIIIEHREQLLHTL